MVVYVDDIIITGGDVVAISELKAYLQSAISDKRFGSVWILSACHLDTCSMV